MMVIIIMPHFRYILQTCSQHTLAHDNFSGGDTSCPALQLVCTKSDHAFLTHSISVIVCIVYLS